MVRPVCGPALRSVTRPPVVIAGGGPVGLAAAGYLARLGHRVEVHEPRRSPDTTGGRAVSVDLSARGQRVLEELGAWEAVRASGLCAVAGRQIHYADDAPLDLPFGQNGRGIVFTVDRVGLTRALRRVVLEHPGVREVVASRILGLRAGRPRFDPPRCAAPGEVLLGCDGARSALRTHLERRGWTQTQLHDLGHRLIPLRLEGSTLRMDRMHLFMCRAGVVVFQPHPDGLFTGGLVLGRGAPDPDSATLWFDFERDLRRLAPHHATLVDQASRAPRIPLVERRTTRWHHGRCLLLGSAAHGFAPYLGQGLNASLEGIRLLAASSAIRGLPAAIALFQSQRQPDIDAIARLSATNYPELSRPGEAQRLRREERHRLLRGQVSAHTLVCFSHTPYRSIEAA